MKDTDLFGSQKSWEALGEWLLYPDIDAASRTGTYRFFSTFPALMSAGRLRPAPVGVGLPGELLRPRAVAFSTFAFSRPRGP